MQNDSLATLLARLEGVLGAVPRRLLRAGRFSHRFYTRAGALFERSSHTVVPCRRLVPSCPCMHMHGSSCAAPRALHMLCISVWQPGT